VVVLLLPLSLSMHEGEAVDNAGGGGGGGGGGGAVAAVDDDDEDGVQWRRWGGRSMAASAFGGGGDGLQIGNVEAKMAIDTSGGGWFEAKMAIDTSGVAGGDSGCQRLTRRRWTKVAVRV
jgi:hypothetical protein